MDWQIVKEKQVPIYQGIMKYIMQHIQIGQLLPGEKLPSERRLAELIGVNRSTIVRVMSELEAKGIVKRKQGSGTIINDDKWGMVNDPVVSWHQLIQSHQPDAQQKLMSQIQNKLTQSSVIDAYTGELPMNLVPAFELPKTNWRDFIEEDQKQDEFGYFPLRQAISDLIYKAYQLSLSVDQMMITSGGHQAIFLIVQTLLNSGDAIAISQPSFFYALPLFQTAGIRLFGVPMDDEGMCVTALEDEILKHRIKFVMLNPTCQNPTGITMSLKRRQAIIRLCRIYNIPIIEDDAFGLLSFDHEKVIPPLKQLDPQNVIYISSLSKFLGSTTKIGWISAPRAVLERLVTARQDLDLTLSIFPQVLAKDAISDPYFPVKLAKLCAQIKTRMLYFLDKLQHNAIPYRPTGGFYVWVTLSPKKNVTLQLTHLLDSGILCLPSFIFGEKAPAIRLNIARLTLAEIDRLVVILEDMLMSDDSVTSV